jgi:hypothetical protein
MPMAAGIPETTERAATKIVFSQRFFVRQDGRRTSAFLIFPVSFLIES